MNEPQPRADVCATLGIGAPPIDGTISAQLDAYRDVTLDEYKQAVTVKIAELVGPKYPHDLNAWEEPDYTNDLNACQGWVMGLPEKQMRQLEDKLEELFPGTKFYSAMQICEAEILRRPK